MRPDPFSPGQSPNSKLEVRMGLGYVRLDMCNTGRGYGNHTIRKDTSLTVNNYEYKQY